jgi:hypothetical protein
MVRLFVIEINKFKLLGAGCWLLVSCLINKILCNIIMNLYSNKKIIIKINFKQQATRTQ